jgi:F0F1-type ATP synthase assembly protein I
MTGSPGHSPQRKGGRSGRSDDQQGRASRGKSDFSSSVMLMLGAGMELGLVTAVLTFGGVWLDEKLDTGPWLMFLGLAIGLIGGTYNAWRMSKRVFDNR